jgi:hypothetical protein
MHPYSTTSEERTILPFALACAAIGFAWVLSLITGRTHPAFWVEVPGTFTLYTILLWVFRSYLWRWPLFQATGIVKIPDLSGDWSGYVTSSFDSTAQQHPVQVRIQQNWTHLLVQLSAEQSESESIVASMAVGEEIVLSYQYRNTPKQGARGTMHAHIGTASLKLSDNRSELSGEYYSGRDRANQGTILLTRGSAPASV